MRARATNLHPPGFCRYQLQGSPRGRLGKAAYHAGDHAALPFPSPTTSPPRAEGHATTPHSNREKSPRRAIENKFDYRIPSARRCFGMATPKRLICNPFGSLSCAPSRTADLNGLAHQGGPGLSGLISGREPRALDPVSRPESSLTTPACLRTYSRTTFWRSDWNKSLSPSIH